MRLLTFFGPGKFALHCKRHCNYKDNIFTMQKHVLILIFIGIIVRFVLFVSKLSMFLYNLDLKLTFGVYITQTVLVMLQAIRTVRLP